MSTKTDIAEIIRDYSDASVANAEEAAEAIIALMPEGAEAREALIEAALNLESIIETTQRVLRDLRGRYGI